MIRRTLVALLFAAAALPLFAQPDPDATKAAQALFERYWDETAAHFPELATYRGDHRYGDRFTDVSPQALRAHDARTRQYLADAQRIARDKLSPTDRVSLELFIEQQQRAVDEQAFEGYRLMSLGSLHGVQVRLAGLLQVQPVSNAERIEQLFRRLAAHPARLDQEIANLRRAVALGWIPSRDVLDAVLRQIDGQLTPPPEKGPWFAPFERLPASLPAAEREAIRARGRDAIAQHVIPPMKKLRAFVVEEAMPKAPANGALSGYPGGAQVYAHLVRAHTTTDLSPQQIHDIGLRELARLRGEMEAVMRETKFEGSFAKFVDTINNDPKFLPASGEALLAAYRDIAKRLDAELPKLFAELPRAPYGIVAMPAHLGNAAEYYSGPALDGSRAGFFYANTVAFKQRPLWGLETLVAHEAVPGHHLQTARAIELGALPAFRRFGGYTVYAEGWGLYAETLGFDLGLYQDPYSRFGHLQWQAVRAARLVVDTGIHALGWSRQRAIDYMVERTGIDREFTQSEIDRYTSTPGQALAYMIGQLEIMRLRDHARAKLGARFDIRRFHNAVLDQGGVSMPALARLVDDWITKQQQP